MTNADWRLPSADRMDECRVAIAWTVAEWQPTVDCLIVLIID
jgi:hypothetical protein